MSYEETARKTVFANGINPFAMQYKTSLPTPKKTKAKAPAPKSLIPESVKLDEGVAQDLPLPDHLSRYQITDDSYESFRAPKVGVYDPLFEKLKYGNCIRCEPSEINKLAGALRKFVKQRKLNANVRAWRTSSDGIGRVWLLGPAKKV